MPPQRLAGQRAKIAVGHLKERDKNVGQPQAAQPFRQFAERGDGDEDQHGGDAEQRAEDDRKEGHPTGRNVETADGKEH